MSLPKSPDEMPIEFYNDGNAIRNCLMGLKQYEFVSLVWEMDIAETNAIGESTGKWQVEIRTRRREFVGEHEDFPNALWFADQLADSHNHEEYEKRWLARAAALAKLSEDERKILGV